MWAFISQFKRQTTAFVVILAIALAVPAAIYAYLEDEPDARRDLLVSLAEAGITLGLVALVGALIAALIKKTFEDHQATRAQAEARAAFHRNILADLKTVYDRVENARLLISAHRSAKTYGEQMRELPGAIVTLHNIKRALQPGHGDLEQRIKQPINAAIFFLKELLGEYRDGYFEASIRQTEYEARKKRYTNSIEKGEPLSRPDHAPVRTYLDGLPVLEVLRADDKANFEALELRFLNHIDAISHEVRKELAPAGREPVIAPDFETKLRKSRAFATLHSEDHSRSGKELGEAMKTRFDKQS